MADDVQVDAVPRSDVVTSPVPADPLDALAACCERMLGTFQHGVELGDVNEFQRGLAALQTVPALIQAAAEAAHAAAALLPDLQDSDPRYNVIVAGLDFVNTGAVFNEAFVNMFQALIAQIGGEFGMAASFFDTAARLFDQYAADHADEQWRADLARARGLYCDGLRIARAGDRAAGCSRIEAAVTLLHSRIYPLEKHPPGIAGTVLVIECSINIDKYLLIVMNEVSKSNFSTALINLAPMPEEINELLAAMKSVELPGDIVAQLERRMSTILLVIEGLEAFAQAGEAASGQQWDMMNGKLTQAKMKIGKARQGFIEDPVLAGAAAQISSISEFLIEPAGRNWQQMRDAYGQAAKWQALYEGLAGKVGVQVMSNVNVEQRVTMTVQVANFFNDRWRDALGELHRALGHLPPDSPERKELMAMIEEQRSQPKEDPTWLDKAKAFTGKASEIVGNVAKTVAPIVSAINICAALCGLPPVIPI